MAKNTLHHGLVLRPKWLFVVGNAVFLGHSLYLRSHLFVAMGWNIREEVVLDLKT